MVAYAHKPSTPDMEARGSRFKVILGYIVEASLGYMISPSSGHCKRIEDLDLLTAEENISVTFTGL